MLKNKIRNKLMAKHIPTPKKLDDIIFVTIGVPFTSIPIAQKVMMYVDRDVNTRVDAAKKLRQDIADHLEDHGWLRGENFSADQLYYEIYLTADSKCPHMASVNSPFVGMA